MGDLILKLNGVDVTDKVMWPDCTFEEQASEGATGTGTIVLRDITTTILPRFGQTVELYDNGSLAWYGTVAPNELSRDNTDRVGNRRVHRITIQDRNTLFDYVRVEGWKRSAESDYTRVRAAFDEFQPGVNKSTYVYSGDNVTMDAKTYRDGMLRDLVADCAEEAGKDYWIDRYDRLHYAAEGSLGSNNTSFSLTDAVATYPANIKALPTPTAFNVGLIVLRNDPFSIPMQNSVMVKYGSKDPAKSITVEDDSSIATYGRIEGLPVFDSRAKSATSARNRARAILARSKNPEPNYQTVVGLPRLDIIQAGMYVSVTSGHQGLSATSLRIARWSARRKGTAGRGYWEVEMDLDRPIRVKNRPLGFDDGGGDAAVPPAPQGTACLWTGPSIEANRIETINEGPPYCTAWIDSLSVYAHKAPAPNNSTDAGSNSTLVVSMSTEDSAAMAEAGSFTFRYRLETDCPDTANLRDKMWANVGATLSTVSSGVSFLLQSRDITGLTVDQITISANGVVGGEGTFPLARRLPTEGSVTIAVASSGDVDIIVDGQTFSVHPSGMATDPIGITLLAGVFFDGTLNPSFDPSPYTYDAMIGSMSFVPVSLALLPWCAPTVPNQQILDELVGYGDLSTTSFFTDYPYVPGSLVIETSGFVEPLVTQTNPNTGEFTFESPPFNGERITATYNAQ